MKWLWTIAILACMMASCGDGTTAPPQARIAPVWSAFDAGVAANTAQEEAMYRAAERLAIALRRPVFRRQVADLLRSSPEREGKIAFSQLVRAHGRFARLLEDSGGVNVDALLRDLDGVGAPIEVYLPIESQRRAWRGEDEFLVAAQLEPGTPPVGFDGYGSMIQLSLEAPPSKPTLVLVPAEGFSPQGTPLRLREGISSPMVCYEDCGGEEVARRSRRPLLRPRDRRPGIT